MRGQPGRGALVGLGVGALLVAALLWLPRALEGDFYEFSDPLVYLGLPILIVGVAAGALFGLLTTSAAHAASGSSTTGPAVTSSGRRVASIAAGTVIVLAVWFALFAMGLL
ncbi:hypothetical protein GCM10023153_24380 [Ornithinibacter aureus]|uniref:Uncharacterized protein n=1 Tax=Ornithinibacter aureus TaxID=622664 RepID=A0ABP8K1F1_9MICO|nr:hypothetical protein [Ornithinibacter aureus]KAF0833049.1 hypothetical protein C8E84_0821 [Ornithinibacter aureus]